MSECKCSLQLLLAQDGVGPTVPDGIPGNLVDLAPKAVTMRSTVTLTRGQGFRSGILRPSIQDAHIKLRFSAPESVLSLPSQRWGIIAPSPQAKLTRGRSGADLVRWVEKLVAHRAKEQGCPVRAPYFVDPNMSAEAAAHFYQTVLMSDPDTRSIPRYLLILGDLDEVSLELQQFLSAMDLCVGRLAFEHEQEYRNYVDKVVYWESQTVHSEAGNAWLWAVRDGSSATTLGASVLIEQIAARSLSADFRPESLPALRPPCEHPQSRESPSLDTFLRVMRTQQPTVLLSLSHGVGNSAAAWGGLASQRAHQGGMRFGKDEILYGERVASGPFLPGGFWFYFACFGAGTPMVSSYAHWLHAALAKTDSTDGETRALLQAVVMALPPGAKYDGRPFVAALPQSVLANPEGPLGVIGHVDLAWSYSFGRRGMDASARYHLNRFTRMIESLAHPARIGVAFRDFIRDMDAVNAELAGKYNAAALSPTTLREPLPQIDATKRSSEGTPLLDEQTELWMLHQDLGCYILLGDPAATLPIGRTKPGFVSPAAGTDPELLRREQFVLRYLANPAAEPQILLEAAVSHAELAKWADTYATAGRTALDALLRAPVSRGR